MRILLGVVCIIGGAFYLFNLLQRRNSQDPWDYAMALKGIIGGIGLIVIGLFLLFSK